MVKIIIMKSWVRDQATEKRGGEGAKRETSAQSRKGVLVCIGGGAAARP